MSLSPKSKLTRFQFLLLLGGLVGGLTLRSGASVPLETRVQAVLVWGTDDAKTNGKSLKELDSKLRERLGNIFKWKNYFEVSRQSTSVPAGKAQSLKLNDECSVEVKVLPDNVAEVKLLTRGKTVVTRRHSLAKPDALVLAGDDKNNTAWFVVLSFN
jgi:hypothetical protein